MQEVTQSKIGKCLKPIKKTEKENVNLATQINNHYYVASRSLTLAHSEVTKHSNFSLYYASLTVKINSSFTKCALWKVNTKNKDTLKFRLKHSENLWIKKRETLTSKRVKLTIK